MGDFNLYTSFDYGSSHLSSGYKSFTQTSGITAKLMGIAEMCLGGLDVFPVIGMVPALVEKTIRTWTLDGRLREREIELKKELEYPFSLLKELTFEMISSSRLPKNLAGELNGLAEGSFVDLQTLSLYEDLENFQAYLESQGLLDSISVEDLQKLNVAIAQLRDVQKPARLINLLMQSSSLKETGKVKKALISHLKEQVTGLLQGESLIIPGGYGNNSIYDAVNKKAQPGKGHAAVLKLVRENDDSYTLKIFNTGEGVNLYHNRSIAEVNEHFYPYCIENISHNSLINEGFFEEFVNLFTNLEHTDRQNTIQDAYACFNKLGPKKKSDPETDRAYHFQGLLAGNCAKKSLLVWLHNELGNGPLYKNFRSYALEQKLLTAQKHIQPNTTFSSPASSNFSIVGGSKNDQIGAAFGLFLGGFFRGSRLKITMPQDICGRIYWYAQQLLSVRDKKIQEKPDTIEPIEIYELELEPGKEMEIVEKIEANPDQTYKLMAFHTLVNQLLAQGDSKSAFGLIDLISERNLKIQMASLTAIKLFTQNRYDEAISGINSLSKIPEMRKNILLNDIFNKGTQGKDVEDCMTLADQLANEIYQSKAYCIIAQKLMKQGDFRRVKEFLPLVRKYGNYGRVLNKLIEVLSKIDPIDEALKKTEELEQYFEIEGEVRNDVFANLIPRLIKEGQMDKAILIASSIEGPLKFNALFLIVQTFIDSKDFLKAFECLNTLDSGKILHGSIIKGLINLEPIEEAIQIALQIPYDEPRDSVLNSLIKKLALNDDDDYLTAQTLVEKIIGPNLKLDAEAFIQSYREHLWKSNY